MAHLAPATARAVFSLALALAVALLPWLGLPAAIKLPAISIAGLLLALLALAGFRRLAPRAEEVNPDFQNDPPPTDAPTS